MRGLPLGLSSMLYGAPISVKWRAVVCGLPVTVEWSHAGIWTVFSAIWMNLYFFSNVCAARYSGVKTYKHSATRVVSGCTQKPSPGHQVRWKEGGQGQEACLENNIQTNFIKYHLQFCPDHINDTGPVVLAENLSDETKAKLRSSRAMSSFAQGVFDCSSDFFICRWSFFLSRQHILCPLSCKVQQSRRQVLSKVGIISLKNLTFFKVGKHGWGDLGAQGCPTWLLRWALALLSFPENITYVLLFSNLVWEWPTKVRLRHSTAENQSKKGGWVGLVLARTSLGAKFWVGILTRQGHISQGSILFVIDGVSDWVTRQASDNR